MSDATITIAGVETKSGTSQSGKAWKLYRVTATDGATYSTFDAGMGHEAEQAQGKTARIQFEQTEKGRNLVALHITGDTPAAAAPAAKTPDGGADWHRIGVQKTRCALWAALFQGGVRDVNVAADLVYAAEVDIFTRALADGSRDDLDVPF